MPRLPRRAVAKPGQLVIGVVGHRRLAEPDKLRRAVSAALDAIAQAYPQRELVVATCLADGADRLVAREAAALYGAKLRVVLPMEADEYEKSFLTSESIAEFRQLLGGAEPPYVMPTLPRVVAEHPKEFGRYYEKANRHLLAISNVLVAIWDGEKRAKPGSTCAVVEGARKSRLPVALIQAGARDDQTLAPVVPDLHRGRLTLERFPGLEPPRPPFIVRMGITAHHDPDAADKPPDVVVESIRRQLAEARCQAEAIHASNRDLFNRRLPRYRVVTRAADGMEVVAAELALEQEFELDLILPFPREDYAGMFRAGAARQRFEGLVARARHVLELDGDRTALEADLRMQGALEREFDDFSEATKVAIRTARHLVLRHSDFLIAVLEPSRDQLDSATASMIERARTRYLETALVPMPTPAQPSPPATAPTPSAGGTVLSVTESDEASPGLRPRLERILLPLRRTGTTSALRRSRRMEGVPEELRPPESDDEHKAETTHEDFYRESEGRAWLGALWIPFRNALADCRLALPRACVRARVDDWQGSWDDVLNPTGFPGHAVDSDTADPVLQRCYAWADTAAGRYGNLTRGAFVYNYVAGAMAVGAAMLGFALGWDAHDHPCHTWDWIWSAVELVLVATILLVAILGRARKWHPRWIDYRAVTEQMRSARILTPLGRTCADAGVPPHVGYGDILETWMYWYSRAWLREFALPNQRITPGHAETCRGTMANLVGDQIRFHASTSRRMRTMARRMHRTGLVLFTISGACSIAHLWLHSPWFTFLNAVLPAAGGAMAAIASQGEFERLNLRSVSMAEKLVEVWKEVEALSMASSSQLGDLADEVATLLVEETLDWRTMVSVQEIRMSG